MLDATTLASLQEGSLRYTWRGLPMAKCPLDLALYGLLLWKLKPRTVIEFGSYKGGSAAWFADQLMAMDLDCWVHSIDVAPPSYEHQGVTFHCGDATKPPETLFLSAERPLLVIDDASHSAAAVLAMLESVAPWMRPGEYIVVEDGVLLDLGLGATYQGGPLAAIERFLATHGNRFEIDRTLCDFFGPNVCWNQNGYLLCNA